MLFDIEDYKYLKMIGQNQKNASEFSPNQFEDWKTVAKACSNGHFKSFMDYFQYAIRFVPLEERPTLLQKFNTWVTKTFELRPIFNNYWNGVMSASIQGMFAEGTLYSVMSNQAYAEEGVLIQFEEPWITIGQPYIYPWEQDVWENYKIFTVGSNGDGGDYTYVTYTQELQDQYMGKIEEIMQLEKEMMLITEGPDFIQDYQP